MTESDNYKQQQVEHTLQTAKVIIYKYQQICNNHQICTEN